MVIFGNLLIISACTIWYYSILFWWSSRVAKSGHTRFLGELSKGCSVRLPLRCPGTGSLFIIILYPAIKSEDPEMIKADAKCTIDYLINKSKTKKRWSETCIKISTDFENFVALNSKSPSKKESSSDQFDNYIILFGILAISGLAFYFIKKNKLNYLPIPVDENIENLKVFEYKNRYKDLFFALSHGGNFGKLKKGKSDERENFIGNLMQLFPNFHFYFLMHFV